jgi:predicted DNA-binding protein
MKTENTPRRHASFRMPPDVLALLDDVSAKTSLSKTKLVEVILREGLKTFRLPKVAISDARQRDMFE